MAYLDPKEPLQTATNNNSPEVTLAQGLQDLSKRNLTVSYLVVGVLSLLFLLGCAGGYTAYRLYQRDIKKAEAAEARAAVAEKRADAAEKLMLQYKAASDKAVADFEDQLKVNSELRRKDAARIAALEQKIKDRDAAAEAAKTDILAKDKTPEGAYNDAAAHYTLKTPFTRAADSKGNPMLSFYIPDVQVFTATKVDADTRGADLKDKQEQLDAANSTVTTLNSDLNKAQSTIGTLQTAVNQCVETVSEKNTTIAEKNKTIDEYKKAAHVGKWRRIWNGAQKVVLFVGGVYIGKKI